MISEKISIFISLVLSTINTCESANFYTHRTGSDHNCVCFKRSGPEVSKVPELIQPGQGLERLVIFLYRNVITNQINVYTPNLEKQKLIPDLPFASDDELTTNCTETINTILNRSPHKTYIRPTPSKKELKAIPIKNIDLAVSHKSDFKTKPDNESQEINNEFKNDQPLQYTNINQIDELEPTRAVPNIEFQENNEKWIYNIPSNFVNINQIDDKEPTRFIPDIESEENNVPSNFININQTDDQEPTHAIRDIESQENNIKWKNNVPSNFININQIDDQEPTNIIPDVKSKENNIKWKYNIPSNFISVNQNDDQEPTNIIPDDESQENNVKLKNNVPSNFSNINQNDDQEPIDIIPDIESQENKNKWKNNVPSNFVNINHIDDQEPTNIITDDESQENNVKWKNKVLFDYITENEFYNHRHVDVTPDIESQENKYKLMDNVPFDYVKYLKQNNDKRNSIDVKPDIEPKENNYKLISHIPNDYIKYAKPISDQRHKESSIPKHLQVTKYPQLVAENSQDIAKYLNAFPAFPQQVQDQFSEWIIKEIETFKNHKNQGNVNIDLKTIGNSILRILFENGMYVTDNGVLIDSYGTILDIHALSLRPILVGSTVPLNNLLQQHGGILSPNGRLSYINAILLTTNYPFKVLGVIPLGETYLPLSTLGTVTNIWKSKPKIVVTKKKHVWIPNIQRVTNDYEVKKFGANEDITDSEKSYEEKANYAPENYDEFLDNTNIEPRTQNKTKQHKKKPIKHKHEHKKGITDSQVYDEDKSNIPLQPSNYTIVDNVISRHNHIAKESPSLVSSHSHDLPSSGNIKRNGDSLKTLKKLSLIDISKNLRHQNLLDSSSIGKIASMVFPSQKDSKNNNILNDFIYKRGNMKQIQEIPGLVSPTQQDFSSRSGITIPEVVGNSDDEKIEGESVVGNSDDDDDDDDGHFRIIGGNAATGSGTPLSNRGRSGNVF